MNLYLNELENPYENVKILKTDWWMNDGQNALRKYQVRFQIRLAKNQILNPSVVFAFSMDPIVKVGVNQESQCLNQLD